MKRTTPLSRVGILRTASVDKTRQKKCRVCKVNPIHRPSAKVCGAECAEVHAKLVADKAARAKAKAVRVIDSARLIELKPKKWWLDKAKKALHSFIRERDEGKRCISCSTILLKLGRIGGDYDAGHFRSVGSAKHLEFVENNIAGQCKRCNEYLSGNQTEYERGLIERHGQAYVDELKADQTPRHLGIDEFKAIEILYKQKLKELKGQS